MYSFGCVFFFCATGARPLGCAKAATDPLGRQDNIVRATRLRKQQNTIAASQVHAQESTKARLDAMPLRAKGREEGQRDGKRNLGIRWCKHDCLLWRKHHYMKINDVFENVNRRTDKKRQSVVRVVICLYSHLVEKVPSAPFALELGTSLVLVWLFGDPSSHDMATSRGRGGWRRTHGLHHRQTGTTIDAPKNGATRVSRAHGVLHFSSSSG